ncbi:hypothetical protein P2318_33305 [Myxococcaceae bacterium GXIMD 01537]
MRQPLARLLVAGLSLGLPFSGLVSCKTGEAATKPVPEVAKCPPCTSFPSTVEVDVTSKGIACSCLGTGGTATFMNKCQRANAAISIGISGPGTAHEPIAGLTQGSEYPVRFYQTGIYTIDAVGCPDDKGDVKTGTLEVGSGTGE